MPDMTHDVARRILDALCTVIDQKTASAKTFNDVPFSDLTTYAAWGQNNNDSTPTMTSRTKALMIAYLMFSGGTIPYTGIQVGNHWFRPDRWIAGSLVKFGYAVADDDAKAFIVTPTGWALAAETLEAIS